MKTEYITPQELEKSLTTGDISTIINKQGTLLLSSVADLIDICEAVKKRILNTTSATIRKNLGDLRADNSAFYILELDQLRLQESLFGETEDGEIALWENGSNRGHSPSMSIRHLSLATNSDTAWWGQNVYEEMEDFFE